MYQIQVHVFTFLQIINKNLSITYYGGVAIYRTIYKNPLRFNILELTLQGLGWYQFPFCEFKMHDIAVKYDWWYQQNSNSQPLGLKSALYQFCQGSNSLGQSVVTDWPKELLPWQN